MISIGDSSFERDALLSASLYLGEGSLVKNVKFVENPVPSELLSQLELLSGNLHTLVNHGTNLDLFLSRQDVQ